MRQAIKTHKSKKRGQKYAFCFITYQHSRKWSQKDMMKKEKIRNSKKQKNKKTVLMIHH